tara:strand:- start:559 stop:915 length:357 start_codon:yes stop_codon:yes gene_type:complete
MTKKHVKNAHMGSHLLIEVYNVSFEKLNDAQKIEDKCVGACKTENLEVLNTYTHQFDPYGVTCTVTLGESHLCCHTWPEKQCVAIDIFTCGNKNPRSVAWWLLEYFDSDDYVMNDYAR